MMPEDRFWEIVAESRARAARSGAEKDDFLDRQMEEAEQVLRGLSPEDIVAFELRFNYYLDLAYREDLWGAACILDVFCSDDGFQDFCATLISLGKEQFFQVLADPDALADLVDRPDVPDLQTEGFQYVAMHAYQAKTGEEIPYPDEERPAPELRPVDFDVNDADAVRRRFPRLTARARETDD